MIEGLTPTEAAERLGVPPLTLVTWLDELPIRCSQDSGGLARLDEDALAVLEAVRGMRAYDLGFQTIRRHLETLDEGEETSGGVAPDTAEAWVSEAPELEALIDLAAPVVDATPTTAAALPTESGTPTTELAAPPVPAFAPPTPLAPPLPPALDPAEVAEAVTRALAPVIATLAELTGAQGRELTSQARLIGQFEADNAFVRRDRDRLAAELVEARARIAVLEARLDARLEAAPRARPWWRFWA